MARPRRLLKNLRFSLRELLMLVALVALSLGFALNYWRLSADVEELAGEVAEWRDQDGELRAQYEVEVAELVETIELLESR